MKKSVYVTVMKPLDWQGQAYAPGDTLVLSPIDTVVLSHTHQVRLMRRKDIPRLVAPTVVVAQPKTRQKRQYHRKDLQAEDAPQTPPSDQGE